MSRVAPKVRAQRSGRPQARGLATRRRVLDAAEALFARLGYEPTSMADVAERAGVGVGTLYHHFPDKRSLLLELIDDWGDRELERGRASMPAHWDRDADLRRLISEALVRASSELRKNGGFRLVLAELGERDLDVRARLARIDQVGMDRIGQFIAQYQAWGRVREEVDPRVAALLVIRTGQAAATEVFVRGVADPPPLHILEGLTDMICRYLLEDSP
jgi:AcrR family transcriptional regulator